MEAASEIVLRCQPNASRMGRTKTPKPLRAPIDTKAIQKVVATLPQPSYRRGRGVALLVHPPFPSRVGPGDVAHRETSARRHRRWYRALSHRHPLQYRQHSARSTGRPGGAWGRSGRAWRRSGTTSPNTPDTTRGAGKRRRWGVPSGFHACGLLPALPSSSRHQGVRCPCATYQLPRASGRCSTCLHENK